MAERMQMAEHCRKLMQRALTEEDAASSKEAWEEWNALPIGVRIRWHARRRFLILWTAAFLFGLERAILDRLFTAWNAVRLNNVDNAELSTISEASTCDTNVDGDAA